MPYSRSHLLAVQKWTQLTALVFDVFHDGYDLATAHIKADLPVLHVDYDRGHSYVSVASHEFREVVNDHVAAQHNTHGWEGEPPYFEDETRATPPLYGHPRDASLL